MNRPPLKSRFAAIALVAALVLVLGWPALATVLAAIRGSGDGLGSGLVTPTAGDYEAGRVARPLDLARRTAELVALVEVLAMALGIPLALVLFRTDAWGRRGVLGLLAVSAFVPLPLQATAWLGAFGNLGRMQALGSSPILVGIAGAAFVHALAALPWVVLLAGIGLRTVEPELEEAALLEMPAARVLATVTLRRSLGALAGAALAGAVLTASDMTVTDLLQIRTYAEEAFVQYQIGQGAGTAASVALPPLAVLGGLVLVAARGVLRAEPARLASASVPGKLWPLGRWRFPVGLGVAALCLSLSGLPLFGLVWRAGRVGGSAALGQPPRWSVGGLAGTLRSALAEVSGPSTSADLSDPLLNEGPVPGVPPLPTLREFLAGPLAGSVGWSAVGASATLVLAWGLAWASREPGPWRWVTASSAALALATPGPVAGLALVSAYLTTPLYDTVAMLVLADVLRTLPYALLVLWPAIRSVPVESFDLAAIEGLDRFEQAWRVGIPSTRGALVGAWCVAFVLALGELPATNLVAPVDRTPMTVVIWGLLHTGVESHLAGVALIMLAVVVLAGVLAAWTCARVGNRPPT